MRTVFFDLDDTIYDRSVPFVRAFREYFGDAYDDKTARKGYITCNARGQEVFADSQTGKMSMRDMYIYRYSMGLWDLGIEIDDEGALRFQALYKKYQKMLEMTPVMESILRKACERFEQTAILTNGPGQHQRDKAACLGIDRWVVDEHIFVSGELGVIKPNKRIFEIAADRMGCAPEEAWLIGDSYESDIAGATDAGWHCIWLNKKRESVPDGAKRPDFEVFTEEELAELIEKV